MRGFARAFVLGALLLPVWPVGPAAAQQRASCDALVNREPISDHGQASHPLDVEADDVLTVVARTRVPSDFFKVEVVFPLVTRTLAEETFDRPTTTAAATIDMTDVSDYGVGLYEVHVSVAGCERKVWVRVVGRSPLTTPAGLVVAAIATAGLALVILALVRTVRGKGGVVFALIGGAILGLGAVGVAQQFGWVGITDKILTTWTAFPALGAAALQQAAALVFRDRAVTVPPIDVPAPPPTPPPPPPPPPPPSPPPAPPAPPISSGDIPEWDTTGPPLTADGGEEEPPPRTAYARLECPEAAVAEEVFELIVGLSAEPTAGVVGEPLVVPPSVVGDYTLTVQVVADGFALRGGRWRRDLRVTGADPYPFVVYKLVAKPRPADVWAKSIQALYSIDGQTIGMAVRSIAVVARADLLDRAPAMPVEPASTVGVPTDEVAPDLTVRILQAVSESDGRLQWTFEAAKHLGIDTPDERIITDIGPSPQTFTKGLIEGVTAKHNDVQLFSFLRGIGSTIADQMPDEFFEILSAVAAKVGDRRPTLLLLSEEPYVPWELALLDPPLDPDTQPYLGAQVEVGRWVLGHRKPKLPPPVNVDVEALAVVAGVYDRAAWRLPEAEEEAATLTQIYGAISVDATSTAVYQCLDGDPAAEVLHFAVHGSYDPESVLEGLVLIDGKTLDLITVRGKNLTKAPLVFLNACQVGSGERVLGDYAGLAASFLRAGASGAIAPLWSIDDNAAKELALRFYERTLRDGETPAAVLRSERASFADPGRDGAATCLAYQFFGHPQMRLRRRG